MFLRRRNSAFPVWWASRRRSATPTLERLSRKSNDFEGAAGGTLPLAASIYAAPTTGRVLRPVRLGLQTVAIAGVGIRGRSMVKTQPFAGRLCA